MPLTKVRNQGLSFTSGVRNLIINGAMQISQRGTSFSYAHDGTIAAYNLDRFNFTMRGGGYADEYDCTVAQVSDSPNGFSNSLKITTGTAESAIAADEYYVLYQSIEGQNLQQLGYGTSSAESITLSFYVKSSLTGTFGTTLYQADDNRVINKTYTISSANTWERKTITFPADTTGVIDNDNGGGLNVYWTFGAGSDFDGGSATTWTAYTTTNLVDSSASDALITTAGATWQVTGVQLEVGDSASNFEHRSFADELRRCQRYYIRKKADSAYTFFGAGFNATTSSSRIHINFPVEMRAAPTIGQSANSTFAIYSGVNSPGFSADATVNNPSTHGTALTTTHPSSTLSVGYGALLMANNSTSAFLEFIAEL